MRISQNGSTGLQAGCTVKNCTSNGNNQDGLQVGTACCWVNGIDYSIAPGNQDAAGVISPGQNFNINVPWANFQ